MKSYKTTMLGWATILGGIATGATLIVQGHLTEGIAAIVAGFTSGLGLINAKDNNVTGGTIQQ